MKLIKRYANRKLYDIKAKRYVTLDDVAEMVRSGVDLKVQDNATREDLTTVILSQLLHENEKEHRSLPRRFLAHLLQNGARVRETLLEKAGHKAQEALQRLGGPTTTQVQALEQRVAALESRLAALESSSPQVRP